jgi:hypothetical protein
MFKKILVLLLVVCSSQSLFAQDLFDLNVIRELRVTFKDKNWDKKLDSLHKLGNEFRLIGNLKIDGVSYDSVGIRYKGNSSYNNVRSQNLSKLPFNIKASEVRGKQRFMGGYETLKLTNIFRDPSYVREVLSYEIARKYMPACKANYVKLYVNDKYLGLYNSIEPIEEQFLAANFKGFNRGMLAKCDQDWEAKAVGSCTINDKSSLLYLGDDPACYQPFYNLKTKNTTKEFIKFVKSLNKEPQNLEKNINVDQVLWMHAFNTVMANLDSYYGKLSHNYYIYKDTNNVWTPLLWDLNLSFGGFRLDGVAPQQLTNEQLQTLTPFNHIANVQYPLISILFKNETYRKMYLAHIRTILKDNFENGEYLKRAQSIQNQIDTQVKSDDNKLYPYETFKTNLVATVDAGKAKIIGISELMTPRTTFLQNHPSIKVLTPTLVEPKSELKDTSVVISISSKDVTKVHLFLRAKNTEYFRTLALKDDGTNGDAKAKDGIYSIVLPRKLVWQYYFVAENDKAASTFPERCGKELLELK